MSLAASVRFGLALRVVDISFTRIARLTGLTGLARLRSGLRLDSGPLFILSINIALIRRVGLEARGSRRIVTQGNPKAALVLKLVETRIDGLVCIPMPSPGDV